MPVFLSGSLLLTGSICTSQGITGATIYGVTAACAPTVFGTTAVCGPTIFGSTAVCSPTVFGTTAVCSPTVFGTTRVCSANLCATTTICGPSFVGGTMSGTTLYGSTVICGASICTTGNICAAGSITGSAILSTGRITAQTLVVSTISSSVTFSSGSNIFGNNPANRQTFTGSLNVSGSGNHFILGANVGIGTALPSEALHISSSGTSPRPALFLETSNASATPEVRLFQTSGRSVLMNLQTNGDWSFQNSTNNSTYNERFRISSSGTASFTANALANSADAATINLKQNSTTANTGIYLERSGEQKGYYMYVGGSVDSLTFQRNNAGTKSDVMVLSRDGCVGIGSTAPSYQLDMCSGTTVNQRIRLQRGSDDTNQNMLLGWNNIVVTRSNVSISSNQTDFSLIQCGSDGARVPFYIGVGGQACFACTVCAPTINMGGTGARKFTLYTDGVSGTCNSSGFGVDLDGASYGAGAFFAYGNSDDGRFVIGSLQNTTFRSKFTIFGSGIGCFASTVCAPTFRGGSSLQLGGYAFQFTAAKNFNENTSDVEFFKIAMGGGQAAIFVNFSSFNYGTAAYKVQTYHGLLSNNWTGWVGCGIEVTGNPSCRANFAASSINSIATYSGCLVFRVSTTNNGTSTQATGTAFITVVTDGTVPTFTQL